MPIQIQQNVPLKDRTTFRVDATARFWAEFSSVEDLSFFYRDPRWAAVPKLILSGGSNVLFVEDFPGLVLHPAIRGIDVVKEDAESVLVEVGAGENWDDFVAHAVAKGWHGLENLSWIPGFVGTCPVQNIGAYGVEVKDVVERVDYFSTADCRIHALSGGDSRFSYRDSIFKHGLRKSAVITRVAFRLRKKPGFTLTYPDLKKELAGKSRPDLISVREAVIAVRKRKLPDPKTLGNAGSFFTNPRVDAKTFENLKARHPHVPGFRMKEGGVKVPAGWLVERCGWRGFREGDAGVSRDHALILVNHGSATGMQILALAERIQASVEDRFGIVLAPEVRVWPGGKRR